MSESAPEERRIADLEYLVDKGETEIASELFLGSTFVKIEDKGNCFEVSIRNPEENNRILATARIEVEKTSETAKYVSQTLMTVFLERCQISPSAAVNEAIAQLMLASS